MADNLLYSVSNITFAYPRAETMLRDISFTITPGESVAVLGANASGKSTLLHLLNGLYFPTSGEIKVYGRALTEESVESLPFSRHFRQNVGFLFQNSDAQLFCSTVEEELQFGPLQLRISPEEVGRRVNDTLQLFELTHLRRRPPHSLSGGEKRRVALAGIVTCAPSVILMDEPGTGLDPRTLRWVTGFLRTLHQSGVTLILASHDLSFVKETTRRALVLSEDHRLIYDGPAREALDNRELLQSVNLI